MSDGLDTGIPAWLQQNWSPKPTFDPTPWLEERYKRSIQAQTVPLQIQGLALQNQQSQLNIQESAMSNELKSLQMGQYSTELPKFNDLAKLAVTDPESFRNQPTSFLNPQLSQQYLQLRQAVAQTDYGIAAQKRVTEDIETAAEVAKNTGYTIKQLPNGRFDPEDFQKGVQMLAEQKQSNLALQHPTASPQITQLTDPSTGRPVVMTRTGPNSWAEIKGEGETVEFTSPSGEKMSIIRGKGGAGGSPDAPTTANRTQIQQTQASALSTIDTANRLEPLINADTVGVRAFTESWVKDRILAQQFPDMVSQDRVKAETLAAQLRSSTIRELRSDGNISEAERKQILEAVPHINDPADSPARAKMLVQSSRQLAAIRAMVATKRLGGAIPKAAAMALDDDSLLNLANQGLITPQEAAQAYQLKRAK